MNVDKLLCVCTKNVHVVSNVRSVHVHVGS